MMYDLFFISLAGILTPLHAMCAFANFTEKRWFWFCVHVLITIFFAAGLMSLVSSHQERVEIIHKYGHIMDETHPQFFPHSVGEIVHLAFPPVPVRSYAFDRTVCHCRGHFRNVVGDKQLVLEKVDHQVVPCRFETLLVDVHLIDTQNPIKIELPGGVVDQPVGGMLSFEHFMPVRFPDFVYGHEYSPATAKRYDANIQPGCRTHLS
ncbi:MAG: hypothetical protein JRD89_04560 [Deltaproteobacteria bacterium]|nr:hypothetical protein [Deltaproteobacteria bacterium]